MITWHTNPPYLQEIGEVMHLAGSGRVIVKLSGTPAEGQVLCDENGTMVARVAEIIGPIDGPFASATPLTNNIKKYVGKSVFASESAGRRRGN